MPLLDRTVEIFDRKVWVGERVTGTSSQDLNTGHQRRTNHEAIGLIFISMIHIVAFLYCTFCISRKKWMGKQKTLREFIYLMEIKRQFSL